MPTIKAEGGIVYDGMRFYKVNDLICFYCLLFKWFSTSLLLCPVHRFSVGILPGTKLESGPAILHLCNNLLVLARDIPPVIIGQWNLPDLRRYGPVPNGFVFEGGTRCGYCELTDVAVVVALRPLTIVPFCCLTKKEEWHRHWCFPVRHLASGMLIL